MIIGLPYYIAQSYDKMVYMDENNEIACVLEDIDYKRKIIILQLPKFRKIASELEKSIINDWITLIDFKNGKEIVHIMENNKNIEKAVVEMDKFSQDKFNVICLQEIEVEKNIQKLKVQEAKEEGIKEGIILNKIDVIKNLKRINTQTSEIIKILSLNEELLENDEIKKALYD